MTIERYGSSAETSVKPQVEDPLLQDMDQALQAARTNKEWRHDYMTLQVLLDDKKEEGREEGENKLGKLIQRLISEGRNDQIEIVIADKEKRQQAYKMYGIE